ncbi:MAG: SDR family oxidoreductase [Myxococcales bacterium]
MVTRHARADLGELFLTIVAESTGYPREMIELDMDLEADLGIDSIKRVEILSTMRSRVPHLPDLNSTTLANLRTLAQIAEVLGQAESVGVRSHSSAAVPLTPTPLSGAPHQAQGEAAATAGRDLGQILLEVVAQSTGYPLEMIELDLDLEADLGIDSIKRVEILSTMRNRVPNLPEVSSASLANLRTLAQIIALYGDASARQLPGAPSPVSERADHPSVQTESAAAGTANRANDLKDVLLEVVAHSTGYPREMIDLDLDLEADLGIDSIKRVEILSALRNRVPDLPEVSSASLTSLRTLGQIIAAFAASKHASAGENALPARSNTDAEATAVSPGAPAPLRLAVRTHPAPESGFAMPGLHGAGTIVVTTDGRGISTALIKALRAQGIAAITEAEGPALSGAAGVIVLAGLRNVDAAGAIEVNREAFGVARAVAARFREHGGLFVTVQDTGGDFGLSGRAAERAWLGGLAALTRSASHEWPKASLKAIDLACGARSPEELAQAIAHELMQGGPELEVGLDAQGSRFTLVSQPAPLPRTPAAGRDDLRDAVFVVSGGARGVTAASLIELTRVAAPRLLLLGRTGLETEPPMLAAATDEGELKRLVLEEARRKGEPSTPRQVGAKVATIVAAREIRATLQALTAAGAEVAYACVDIRDETALNLVLDEVRRAWGPIRGLIHGAGVLADAFLDKKTEAQFAHVFDTKVLGLRTLLRATRSDPLRWLCMFSSVAAREGNAGQADYAMANEVLNQVAAAEARVRGDGCRVAALGWGPWEGGMVTPTLREHFRSRGIALLPVAEGARCFVDELALSERTDVQVVIGGGLMAKGRRQQLSAEVMVDAESHPQLESHRVRGQVVLPMVLVLEWFARLSRSLFPASAITVRDLRVLRGITLARYREEPERFSLSARRLDEHSAELELRNEVGELCYRANSEVCEESRSEARLTKDTLVGGLNAVDAYRSHMLFHGEYFHVLRSIEGLSAQGARAHLAGVRELDWPEENWSTDPAALDGALQLAILCGQQTVGATLPMRIEAIHLFAPLPTQGTVGCELRVRSQSSEHLVCDARLTDSHGSVLVELAGCEMYLIPGGTPEEAPRQASAHV